MKSEESSLLKHQSLILALSLNFARDFLWTTWSYDQLDYRIKETFDETYDASGEWFGQQIWGTIAMVVTAVLLGIIYNSECLFKNLLVYLLAASAAIYTWDRGQLWGIQIGQSTLGMTPNDSAYFASIPTGCFEGPTQFLVITVGTLCLDQKERGKVSRAYWKGKFLELLFSVTIGAVPGAMWQVVYSCCIIAESGYLIASGFVAVYVCICNFVVAKISEAWFGEAEVTEEFSGKQTEESTSVDPNKNSTLVDSLLDNNPGDQAKMEVNINIPDETPAAVLA